MMRNKKALAGCAILALLLMSSPGEAAEFCNRVGRYHLNNAGPWPMHIAAHPGTTCEATFGSYGTGDLVFKRLLVVMAPTRGKIRLREGGYYIYTAPSGAGTDSFTLRVCGSEGGQDGCADLQYSVTVQ